MTHFQIFLLCLAAWWLCGMYAFWYDWTKDHDLTTSEVMLFVISGANGPVALIIWVLPDLFCGLKVSHILFKKRGRR